MEKTILTYYNELAPLYDTDRFANTYGNFIHAQEFHFLNANIPKNKRPIVDMGCGTGRFLQFAQIGVDLSPEMLKVAALKYPEITFYNEDATRTTLKENSIEMAFSMHVFMHLDKEKTLSFLAEAHRILKPKAQFIFDFPSKKRRLLTHRKDENWHGNNAFSMKDISLIADNQWIIKKYEGLLWLPIHRIPKKIRKYFLKIDTWLCQSFLKDYASYLIVVLEKK